MNKWSLLLFSVLGLLLSTTSELNFVDGRLGCCGRLSRPLLSDTRLSIYEPDCTYHTFTETNQLISSQRDIPYASRNVELKLPSGSEDRREKFLGRRISSDERFKVLSNVVVDLEGSTLSNTRHRKAVREINDFKLRRNLKFSRNNFRENHVDRSRFRNNDFLGNKMERNSLERGLNIEEELSKIWDNRFRHIDGPVSSNLKDRKQERFNRRTFVIRPNIIPNTRENIDEIKLRFIKKNEGKRDIRVERSNLDINTRQRLFRDTRLTSDLSKNSDHRFKKDERITQLSSKTDILRNRNIRNYRRLSVQEDSIEKMYERESLTDVRCNTDMYGTVNVDKRSYDRDTSEEIVERINSKNVVIRNKNIRFTRLDKSSSRPLTIQRENEGSGHRIRDDKKQMNNGFETRLFKKRYSNRHLPRQNSNINRLQEIQQARLFNDMIIEDGRTEYSNVFIERNERASDQSRNRKNRENNREIRIREEFMAGCITPLNINCLVEKRTGSSNIHKRRSEAIRDSELQRRERETSRYRLGHENENNFDQRRIRQIRSSYNEDKFREARNTQQRMIRNNAMGQEINNIRQIYDDDNVSQRFLVRDDNNKKLVSRFEREILSGTVKLASLIRINKRDNQIKTHIRAMNLQENRIEADPNFNGRLLSNANTNIENRRARTYNEKSDRKELRNSLVREAERAFDENRIRQVRNKHEYRREYRSNVERTVGRVLSRIGRYRNNVVESGFVSIISSIGNNRIYGTIRSAVTVLRRRENYEVRYRSAHENERILDQRRTRDVLEHREDDLSNEWFAQRNVAPRNSINNAMLYKNRRSYNNDNNSQEILVSINQREIINRSEKERFSTDVKRSSYLRMIRREHENRRCNDYTQPMHIQENRLRSERCGKRCLAGHLSNVNRIKEVRRVGTPKENLNTLLLIRSVDESRISHLRDSFEYRLNEKLNAERVLERNINKIIEKRESIIRHQKTKRTHTLLQLREIDVFSLMRLNVREFEQNGNGILRNKREVTRIEDHGRNIPVAAMRGLKNINERSNIRGTHNKLITRYIATEVEFYDSDETQHERRTERAIHFVRQRASINNRDLQEARSEKQRDANRDLQYIRYVRNYNGLENRAHCENKENVRTSDGDNNRGRDAQDIRSSNGLRISKTVSRITKTRRTNEEEREMRTAFLKIRYLPIEHKPRSDNQIFEIKLQYMFYILQAIYILGLFTKFTVNSNGIQKRTRFSNWFPLFSTLKVH